MDVQGNAAAVRQDAVPRTEQWQPDFRHNLRQQRQVAGEARIEDRLDLHVPSGVLGSEHREMHHRFALSGDDARDRRALGGAGYARRAQGSPPEAVGRRSRGLRAARTASRPAS